MEKSMFLQVFGASPKLRIVDFLVVHSEFDYSMKDIAIKSGVGYSTLRLFWKDLVNQGVVRLTRKLGKAKLYKLNRANPAVKTFEEMYWKITDEIIEQKRKRREKAIA